MITESNKTLRYFIFQMIMGLLGMIVWFRYDISWISLLMISTYHAAIFVLTVYMDFNKVLEKKK